MKTYSKLFIIALTMGFILSSIQIGHALLRLPVENFELDYQATIELKELGMLLVTHLEPELLNQSISNALFKARCNRFNYGTWRYHNVTPGKEVHQMHGCSKVSGPFFLYVPNDGDERGYRASECYYLIIDDIEYYSPEKRALHTANSVKHEKLDTEKLIYFPIPKGSILTPNGTVWLPGGIVPAIIEINSFINSNGNKFLKGLLETVKKKTFDFSVKNGLTSVQVKEFTEKTVERFTSYESIRHALMYLLDALEFAKSLFSQDPIKSKELNDLAQFIQQTLGFIYHHSSFLSKELASLKKCTFQVQCFYNNATALGVEYVPHPNDTPLGSESSRSSNPGSSILSSNSESRETLKKLLGVENPFPHSSSSSSSAGSSIASSSSNAGNKPKHKPSYYLTRNFSENDSGLLGASSSSSSSRSAGSSIDMDTTPIERKNQSSSMSEK